MSKQGVHPIMVHNSTSRRGKGPMRWYVHKRMFLQSRGEVEHESYVDMNTNKMRKCMRDEEIELPSRVME